MPAARQATSSSERGSRSATPGKPKNPPNNKGVELGQAHALHGEQWPAWLDHVRRQEGAWLMVLVWLCGCFGVRQQQVARLRVENVGLKAKSVYFRKFKKRAAVWKGMVPSVAQGIKRFWKSGVPAPTVERKAGRRGVEMKDLSWAPPSKGYLFPRQRSDSRTPWIGKNTICHKIGRCADTFIEKFSGQWPDLLEERPRSHSGRRRKITWMAVQGTPDVLGQAWVQISDNRLYRHYVDVKPSAAFPELCRADKKCPLGRIRPYGRQG